MMALVPTRTSRGLPAVLLAWVAFQLAWFACVLGAAHGWPWAGVAVAGLVVLASIALSAEPRADARLVAVAWVLGAFADGALLHSGWVTYAEPGPLPAFAPAWILALWALFATLLREPLRWLHRRPLVAAAFGAIGGPLSYLAAERLGAVSLADRAPALAALAIGWACITPALLALAQRWETR